MKRELTTAPDGASTRNDHARENGIVFAWDCSLKEVVDVVVVVVGSTGMAMANDAGPWLAEGRNCRQRRKATG